MSNQPTPYQQIVAKAWSDPEYKERLLHEPKAVLRETGIEMPENVDVKVHANTDDVVHLVLPTSPAGEALSHEELEQVAGGTWTWHIATCIVTFIEGCRTVGVECEP